MATYINPTTVTRTAGSAITIYRFVVFAAGDSKYDMVSSAQGDFDGIAAEAAAADGDAFSMAIPNGSIVKVEAGAAVSAGAIVASDASGRAITAVSGLGNYTAGKALKAASAAGEIIEIQFLKDLDQVA